MARLSQRLIRPSLLFVVTAFSVIPAHPDVLDLPASQDACIYSDPGFEFGNGSGQHMIAGRTAVGNLRRALIRFDIAAAVPPGAVIESVTLTLNMSRTSFASGPYSVALHRLTASWSEGPSDAGDQEGTGEPASIGDVTWNFREFNTLPWAAAGGEFAAAPSAAIIVDLPGSYSWGSSTGMILDVQDWLDNPPANFGWILIGDETTDVTAKRFDSRTNPIDLFHPKLTIVFEVPGILGDMNCDGIVTPGDIAGFVLALTNPAEYMAMFPDCNILNADINQDGVVSPGDIAGFVSLLVGG